MTEKTQSGDASLFRWSSTAIDLAALGVIAMLFIVGWISFVFIQPLGEAQKFVLLFGGVFAYSVALNRLSVITPLISDE